MTYSIIPCRFWYHGWCRQVWECLLCEVATGCFWWDRRRSNWRKVEWEQGKLNGAPNKVGEIVQFHIGDVLNCLQKASLIPGGGECTMYGTVMGSMGTLLPFTSRDDVDYFSDLEMHLRQDHPPLCGRDHMAYRCAYFPVKVSHYW